MVSRYRLIVLVCLIILSIVGWIVNFNYPNVYLEKTAYTAVALTVVYFLFEVLFEELGTKRIKDSKTRYSMRKVISVLSVTIFVLTAISIWIAETQNILIAVGLLGAAIAFGLQDIFKNFMGGVMIYVNGIYRVGDRVEINRAYGDVIDISIFYTTLMETRGWVGGDQATGRLTTIPNGGILTGNVQNYTKDFNFMWDELTLPITYDSDWKSAQDKIFAIIKAETAQVADNAKKTMELIEGKYYFTQRSLEPAIYVTLTDNWINFGIRYVTEVRTRRALNNRLSRLILEEFEKSPSIKIASTTMQITGFPPIQVEQETK